MAIFLVIILVQDAWEFFPLPAVSRVELTAHRPKSPFPVIFAFKNWFPQVVVAQLLSKWNHQEKHLNRAAIIWNHHANSLIFSYCQWLYEKIAFFKSNKYVRLLTTSPLAHGFLLLSFTLGCFGLNLSVHSDLLSFCTPVLMELQSHFLIDHDCPRDSFPF